MSQLPTRQKKTENIIHNCYITEGGITYWQILTYTTRIASQDISACMFQNQKLKGNGKADPLQAWSGPEGSRKLRFPDYTTTAQDDGKAVSLTHRPPLLPENAPGTYFC
jgi:hypothetical protein